MQRALLLFSALFSLYACTSTVPQVQPSPPAKAVEQPAAVPPPVETPVPAPAPVETLPLPVPAPIVLPNITPFPHIALLLPVKSAIFGPAAEAVQKGFFAAASINDKSLIMPVRVYSDFDENNSVVAAYRQAIANGARAVVGPLTRNGVSALAAEKDIPVPTLALNIADGQFAPQLYFFGMAIEAEARQVAQLAKRQGLHQAIIVTTNTPLSLRLQAAFEEEWTNSAHGADRGILREIEYDGDPSVFADIADITDTMVFLAADAANSRLIRPYLPNKLPVYATSQVFTGNDNTLANYDMNGIHFVDMPWMLQPDHPAVMIYPHPNPPLTASQERLYALGIDSYRLIELLITGTINNDLPLDGVTGQISLNGHDFERTAVPAVFAQGHAQLGDAPAAPPSQMFPPQPITPP
ncbi:MAG: penicillin-binding protein activator [Gallionella sp.]